MKTIFFKTIAFLMGFAFSASCKAIELPVKIINGMPYLEAKINNKGPYLFGFDSGFGGELELDSSLAKKIGIISTGNREMGDPSGQNNIVFPEAKIKTLQLGSETFKNFSAILRNRRAMPGMEKVAGILGISLFKNYLIALDYQNLKFTLGAGALAPANNKTIFKYVTSGGGVPGITIKVGNNNITAFLDTRGMSSSFVFPETLIKKLNLASEPRVVGRARTVSNEITINEVKLKDNIVFGDFEYASQNVSYPSLNEDALIGAKILQQFTITIDQKNKRLQLIRGNVLSQVSKEIKPNSNTNDYVGQYELRTISIDDKGNLSIQRTDGPKLTMIKKGVDEYTLETVRTAIIKFERDKSGKVIAMKVLNRDGNWENSKKLD